MLHLRLFGGATLQRGDVALTGRAVQRHRLALLSLLALAPGRRLSRDKLLGLLWPERDTDSARNLLKVGTHVLRSELGEEVLLSEGDGLRLNPERIETDATSFLAAISGLDFAHAVGLYRGPFLDGFFLPDSPEFEEWSSQQRLQLAAEFATAVEMLAAGAEAAGDPLAAAGWWQKRAAHEPLDTRVALRLMAALEASGNPAGALAHAAVHEALLREELGLDAPPELAAASAHLRERRSADAGVEPAAFGPDDSPDAGAEADAAEAPVAADTPGMVAVPTSRDATWIRRLGRPLAAVAVLAVAVLAWAWGMREEPDRTLVVLPFVNYSTDADNEYFADGLTEEITARLSRLEGMTVISRTSAMHYKASSRPLREIAADLGVAHVLEGSVRRSGNTVRITAQLIDARADEHMWAESYELELDDSFRAQEQIARAVALALEVRLGGDQEKVIARRGTRDLEAEELYRRGRYLWDTRTPAAHEQAENYFRRAIERDPDFADAYAALAHAYLTSHQLGFTRLPEAETYSRMKWAAERALALDPQSPDSHTAAALVSWWQSNWPGAERELLRAIELNPNGNVARYWYALLLGGMGRLDESLDQARQALQVDPHGMIANITVGWACRHSRDSECAKLYFRRTLELNPDWAPAYGQLARELAASGDLAAALDTMKVARRRVPESNLALLDLAYIYALSDSVEQARRLLAEVTPRTGDAIRIAHVYIALNQPDSAFAWLDREQWQWCNRATLYEPSLDPIRSDPRFAALTLRVKQETGMQSRLSDPEAR